jgi:hypothetical protein
MNGKISNFFFLCFSFFSFFSFCPLISGHEITPYYLIFIFLGYFISSQKDTLNTFLVFLALLFFLLYLYLFKSLQIYFDVACLTVVFLTVRIFSLIKLPDRQRIATYVYLFSIGILIYTFLLWAFPILQVLHVKFLTTREVHSIEMYAIARRSTGIAPEPAYMASWIIGSWVLICTFLPNLRIKSSVISALGIYFTGSLSGEAMFLLLLVILWGNSLKNLSFLIFLGFLAIGLIFLFDSSFLKKPFTLITFLSSSNSYGIDILTSIDELFGSKRVSSLTPSFYSLGCGSIFCDVQNTHGYSYYAELYYKFAPLHLLAILFLLINIKNRMQLISFICFFTYGPILNWMLFSGFTAKDGKNL